MKISKRNVFASIIAASVAAVIFAASEAQAEEVAIRNVQIVDTARESWIMATVVNRSGFTLEGTTAAFVVDGKQVVVPGPRLENGEAWRISHKLDGRPKEVVGAFATWTDEPAQPVAAK